MDGWCVLAIMADQQQQSGQGDQKKPWYKHPLYMSVVAFVGIGVVAKGLRRLHRIYNNRVVRDMAGIRANQVDRATTAVNEHFYYTNSTKHTPAELKRLGFSFPKRR